jgi:hypothetical protein
MNTPKYIITHPGAAHRDDFLSMCILSYTFPEVAIYRLQPTPADLRNPDVMVVDVGMEYNSELNNFDHHQFPASNDNALCAFSLILKEFKLYDDFKKYYPWMDITEKFDVRGPYQLSAMLGITSDSLFSLDSPIEKYVLSLFEKETLLGTWCPVGKIMYEIGKQMVEGYTELKKRINIIKENHIYLPIYNDVKALFVPRIEKVNIENPFLGIDIFLKDITDDVPVIVIPNDRCDGYKIIRRDDDTRVDFRRYSIDEQAYFVHANGFILATNVNDIELVKKVLDICVEKK